VAPHFHGFERQRRMRGGGRQDVDYLWLGFRHRLERWIDLGDSKLGCQGGGAVLIEVGNPYDLDKRQAAQCPGMIRADVSGAYQSYFDKLVPFQNCGP
jgi:hypothetical protein